MNLLRYLICFSLLAWALPVFAQDDEPPVKEEPTSDCPDPENDKAVKLYKKAMDKKKYEYAQRMDFLKECLELEPEYAQANFEYGKQLVAVYKNRDQPIKGAEKYFKAVIDQCPNLHTDPYYYLAIIAWEDKNYKDCVKYCDAYLNFKTEDEKKVNPKFAQFSVDMKNLKKWSVIYEELYGKTVPYDPKIVAGLSSVRSEYLPFISPDNQLMFYTRQVKPSSKSVVDVDRIIEKFHVSKKKPDGGWDDGTWMPEPFNMGNNEGGACVTVDNKHLYFTICKDEGGPQPECDIYYSDNIGGKWSAIRKVPNLNAKDRWDSQPSVSSDGNTIYFASDRPGGYGGVDLYMVQKDSYGNWGPPKNLGPKINTSGDEKAPFMHSDSQTLYFSSGPSYTGEGGGWPGAGGMDIFLVKMDEQGKWMEPKNIGIPINTKGDEVGLIVSTDGKLAYFASDDAKRSKNQTLGGYDIYAFELYKEARPEKVMFIEGNLKDTSGKPFKEVNIELKDAVTKKTIKAIYDTTDGTYRGVIVDKGNDVLVKVESKGHSFTSQLISKKDSLPTEKMITRVNPPPPKPIVPGQKYTLNNIYYKTGSADLDPKSKIVLEEFSGWLKKNPEIRIEIHGHTDDVGNDEDNLRLSKDRAFTVLETLISLGVNKSQLIAFKGFGEQNPVADNSSEFNRARNRRTEFMIVK